MESEVTDLFQVLRRVAFALCNGGRATVDVREAMALVEAGLSMVVDPADSSYKDVTLEPMVLVAFMRAHFEEDFFVERLRALQNSASSMGFEFEYVVGHRLTQSWLTPNVAFKDLPLIKPFAKKLPAWCAGATLRAFEPRLGRVAEPGADLHTWFHRQLARARSAEAGAEWGVMGKFPGRYAGPDFAMLVRVEGGTGGAGPAPPVLELVLVQVRSSRPKSPPTCCTRELREHKRGESR